MHRDGRQGDVGSARMQAGAHVVFETVPRASDQQTVVGIGATVAGLRFVHDFLDRSEKAVLIDRPALVWTVVDPREKLPVESRHPDLHLADGDDLAAWILKFVNSSNTHRLHRRHNLS